MAPVRELTLVLPHFENLGMLAEQQKVWMDYPPEWRERLHVIVADDCSNPKRKPEARHLTATGLASLRMYRALEKKRWNWLACRNKGAAEATTDWLFLTDIDHVVPLATLQRVLGGDLDPQNAYRFNRVTATATWPYDVAAQPAYKPHNDTWLITRQTFFDERVGGYDERLSGCYGTSGEFTDRLTAVAKQRVLLSEVIVRYPREIIPDASTSPRVYTRKGDPKNDRRLAQLKAERAEIENWKPLHGLVPWEQVA